MHSENAEMTAPVGIQSTTTIGSPRFKAPRAVFAYNGKIKCPQHMGFPRPVLSANQNAATASEAAEIKYVLAVERTEIF